MWPQKWKASAFWARMASRTNPPPATPSSSRPVRARKPRRELAAAMLSLSTDRPGGVRQEALQLVERVERALGEHLAVGREHNGIRAARDGERGPRVGVGLLVEELQLDSRVIREQSQGRLERHTQGAVRRGERRDGERCPALEAIDQADAAAELGAFVVDRERRLWGNREPQLAELARQREQRDGERCYSDERDPEADPEPRLRRGLRVREQGEGEKGGREQRGSRHASPAEP